MAAFDIAGGGGGIGCTPKAIAAAPADLEDALP
jgi:hypothetical protein